MIQQQYPSQLLEKAVTEFSKLPGIGRKTALRLVLWMLRQEDSEVEQFAEAVHRLKHEVKYCQTCHNISDSDTCPICSDPRRDASTICVVENIQDVMAIENTQQFHGLYHVIDTLALYWITFIVVIIEQQCFRISLTSILECLSDEFITSNLIEL